MPTRVANFPLTSPSRQKAAGTRLAPGPYVIVIHELLNIPRDLMALVFPRSTLLRRGARLGTAVIDAGYRGQPEALLLVENPHGLDLGAEAGICQVVFFPLSAQVEGYRGSYQGSFSQTRRQVTQKASFGVRHNRSGLHQREIVVSRGALAGQALGRTWMASAAGFGGVLAVVVAAALAFQVAYADRIVAGVRVLGLDLGGQSPDAGRALLAGSAAQLTQQLVTLHGAGREWQLTAAELGMRVDADAMVEQAYQIGRVGNPAQRVASQWGALFFGARFASPLLQFDPERQSAVLNRIRGEIDQPAIDARIDTQASQSGRVVIAAVPEIPGARLLMPESAQRMRDAIARGLPTTVELAIVVVRPNLTRTSVEPTRARAERLVEGPVTLTLGNRSWSLSAADIATTLVFEPAGNQLQVSIKPDALKPLVAMIDQQIGQLPSNARFEWNGGNLRLIRDSQDGRGADVTVLARIFEERLPTAERTFTVPVTTTQARVTAEDGPKLGLKELIKEGRTSFAGASAEKTFNVGLAASRLNGTVVPPNEIFSFNREVGPTTLDAGFKTGWGITVSSTGAKTIPSVAGGICQVATTMFQPVFHAGYAIEERHNHLYWIQSYGQPPLGMKGLDATVDEAFGLDFQFINNTPNYLLVQSRVEGSAIIFGLYGTKPNWDVKIEGPVISNVVPTDPAPQREVEPTMPTGRSLQVEAAQDGFDALVTRTVTEGAETRRLPLRSHYVPAHNVILHGPEPEAPPEDPASPAGIEGQPQNSTGGPTGAAGQALERTTPAQPASGQAAPIRQPAAPTAGATPPAPTPAAITTPAAVGAVQPGVPPASGTTTR